MAFDLSTAAKYLNEALPNYLGDLEELVNIDSGTFDKGGIDQVGRILQDRYSELGGRLELHSHAERGDTFTVKLDGNGTDNVLLIGHLDTVYAKGTAAARPFRISGERAYGPGVSDMKSGDLAIVYALGALQAQDCGPFRRLTVVHNSDEEIGSPSSRNLIRSESEWADAVLVLEPGRENGNIVSARKGIADCRLQVHGRAAHAGNAHERGRSAVRELAHKIVHLEALNGTIGGVTLNVGRIESGDRINVVPERAFAHFEVRAFDAESLEAVLNRCRKIADGSTVDGTTATLEVSVEHYPMHKSGESDRLVTVAKSLATQLGFTVEDIRTGGASDGNTAAAAGRPVLDGLGPIGGSLHSPDEYMEVPSVVPRIGLLAGLIHAVGLGQW
jgi:glutamate carboxypeptidase